MKFLTLTKKPIILVEEPFKSSIGKTTTNIVEDAVQRQLHLMWKWLKYALNVDLQALQGFALQ